MSKDWHSGHFSCWQCDEALTGQRYVLRDEHPYCIKCYESVFANVCEECNKIIGIDSKVIIYVFSILLTCFRCTGESIALAKCFNNSLFKFLDISFCFILSDRICRTRTNTGMKPVSYVTSAESASSTSNLDLKLRKFTAEIATMPNLRPGVMDVARYSAQVSSFFYILRTFFYLSAEVMQ